jgi:hypothetical protein
MKRVVLFFTFAMLLLSARTPSLAATHDEMVSKYLSLKASGQQEYELGARPIDEQSIPPELRKKVDAFRVRLNQDSYQYYAGRLTDQELRKLIEWYGSTAGKKSATALHTLYWPTITDMMVCGMGMGHVTPDFLDRYKKLDDCFHYTEEKTAGVIAVYNDMVSRKGVFSPDPGAKAVPEIPQDQLSAMKESMLTSAKRGIRAFFAFCFLKLSEGEIQSCTNFYGSALGRKELDLFEVRRKILQNEISVFFKENSEIIKSLMTPSNSQLSAPVNPEKAR